MAEKLLQLELNVNMIQRYQVPVDTECQMCGFEKKQNKQKKIEGYLYFSCLGEVSLVER